MEGVEGGAGVVYGMPRGAMGDGDDGDVCGMLEEEAGGDEVDRVVEATGGV